MTHADLFAQAAIAPGQRPERVGAVIVTYFATEPELTGLLRAVEGQVEFVVIVDNTPGVLEHAGPDGRMRWRIANGTNRGLAEAQNQGLAALRSHGLTHALLLDQDSLPAPDMVAHLIAAIRELNAAGERPAAVGPRWRDRHSQRSAPFVRLGLGRMHAADDASIVECDTLISSGCLIPLSVIDAVGAMDSALFIDQVDTEWGLRAQMKGFRLYGVRDAVLTHGIGEAFVRPWFAPRRTLPLHSPVRDYYVVRNTIAVFFRRAAPWRWRLLQLIRLPGVIIVMLTQMPARAQRLQMVIRGLVDGFAGRLGPSRRPPGP